MFASNLAVTMSFTALLKDQNDKIILNKFTVYTFYIGETRKWFVISPPQNKIHFFFFFSLPPHTRRLIGNPLINSSWPYDSIKLLKQCVDADLEGQ